MTGVIADDDALARKARGAYFTPPAICAWSARWAVRASSDRVLEPSCGEAAFLLAAARRLQGLGEARPELTAVEMHEPTAAVAAAVLQAADTRPRVIVGDFLAQPGTATFDAVLGNPPFIRYQSFTGESRAVGARAALAEGVRLTGLSSSWAAFVVHASAFLRPGGRMALVLPGELLSSNYAVAVRRYLQTHFGELTVMLFDGQVFPGAQTETLLLLAGDRGGSTTEVAFCRVASTADLTGDGPPVTRRVLRPEDKWTTSLTEPATLEALQALTATAALTGAGAWGRISLGAVTGANSFFALTANQVRDHGLSAGDVVPLSPPGSTHLRALTIDHASVAAAGQRAFLFHPASPSAAARRYIASGVENGVDQAYKCRVRDPWWRVPLPPVADLLLTYMNAHTPQFASNPAGLRHVNSVHGVVLDPALRPFTDVLPVAALNSATMLSAELTGRAYGGGILKLEPREAAQLAVPAGDLVADLAGPLRAIAPKVAELLRAGRLTDAVPLVDEVVLSDGFGLSTEILLALRRDRTLLADRRRARGRTAGRSPRDG